MNTLNHYYIMASKGSINLDDGIEKRLVLKLNYPYNNSIEGNRTIDSL